MEAEPLPDLTEAQKEKLQQALLELREELASVLSRSGEASQPVDLDEPIGRLTRMDAMQQQKMAAASRNGLVLRAKQVDAALERFEEGTYGACLSCEENVGLRRLEARPETPFCIACQGQRERR